MKKFILISLLVLLGAGCATSQSNPAPTHILDTAVPATETMTLAPSQTSAPTNTPTPNAIQAAVATSVAQATAAAQTATAAPTKTQTPIPTPSSTQPTPTPLPTPAGPVWNLALSYLTAYYQSNIPLDPVIIATNAEYISTEDYGIEGACPWYSAELEGYSISWLLCAFIKSADYTPNEEIAKDFLNDGWIQLDSSLSYGELGKLKVAAQPDGSKYAAWLPLGEDIISVQANLDAAVNDTPQLFFNTHLAETFNRLIHRMLADIGQPIAGMYFEDDFSHPTGWQFFEAANYSAAYEDEKYVIRLQEPYTSFVFTPNLFSEVQDVRVQAEMTLVEGEANEVYYGVVCRYQDINNFYMLRITGSGYYSLAKRVNDNLSVLGVGKWKNAPNAIKTMGNLNTIRADCVGNTLTFYVNEIKVTEVIDTDLSSGFYGLVVGTMNNDVNNRVVFDNFRATVP